MNEYVLVWRWSGGHSARASKCDIAKSGKPYERKGPCMETQAQLVAQAHVDLMTDAVIAVGSAHGRPKRGAGGNPGQLAGGTRCGGTDPF